MNAGLRKLYGSIRAGNWEQALELFPLAVFDFSRQHSSSPTSSTSASTTSNSGHERTGSVLSELMKLCRANGRNREAVQVFSAALETGLHCCSEADKEGMESLQELRNTKESITQVREQLRISQQQKCSTATHALPSSRRNNDVALYDSKRSRIPYHMVAPSSSLVLTRSVSGGDESAWSQSLRLLFLLRANSTPGRDSPALRVAVPPPNKSSVPLCSGGDSLEDCADLYCQTVASQILEAPTAKEKIEIVTRELSEICHGGVGQNTAQKDGTNSLIHIVPAYTLDFVRCLAAVALDHAVAYSNDESGADDCDAAHPPSCLLDASTSGNLAAFDSVFFTLVSKWGSKYTFASLDANIRSGGNNRGTGPFHRGFRGSGPPPAVKHHVLVPKEGSNNVVYSPGSLSTPHSTSSSYLPPHLTAEDRMEYLFGSLSASHSSQPPHTRTFVILDVDYILSQKFVKLIAEMAMSTSSTSSNGEKTRGPAAAHPHRSVPDVWSSSVYHNAELVVTFSTLMALLEYAMTSPLAKERLDHLVAARTSYSPRNGGGVNSSGDQNEYAVVRRRFGSLVSMLPEDLQADLFGTNDSRPRRATPTAQQPRDIRGGGGGGVTILGLQEEIMLTQITAGDVTKCGVATTFTNTSDEQTALADVHQRTQRLVAVARVISNIVRDASSSSSKTKDGLGRTSTSTFTAATPKGAGSAVDSILRSIGLGHLSEENAVGDVFLGDGGGCGAVVNTSRERCNVLVGAIAGGAVARACQTKGVQIL